MCAYEWYACVCVCGCGCEDLRLTLMAVWLFSDGALYGPTASISVKLSPAWEGVMY